jgi:hypothetical protein
MITKSSILKSIVRIYYEFIIQYILSTFSENNFSASVPPYIEIKTGVVPTAINSWAFLSCEIEAYPTDIVTYWERGNDDRMLGKSKGTVENA